jgi:hypothetical protein
MMPLLCFGLVLLLLVAAGIFTTWLMMPLCPAERLGFEEYDLLDQLESVRAAELRGGIGHGSSMELGGSAASVSELQG